MTKNNIGTQSYFYGTQSKQYSIVFMQPEGYSKVWVINIIP